MKAIYILSCALVVIGALNWLLVGAIGWDVGALFGGQDALISRIIYIVVGISAIVMLVTHKKACGAKAAPMMQGGM